MAPPAAATFERIDYNAPASAASNLLTQKNPELLKAETYSKYLREAQEPYYTRAKDLPGIVAELHAKGFPERRPDVVVGTSGPQGKVVPYTIIDDPADWTASSWEGREEEFTYRLTDSDLAEIDEAVQGLKKRGLSTEDDIKGLKKEDFPLPTLGPKLVELALNATHGRGFQFITGFPVIQYKHDRFALVAAYWAIGLHIGRHLVTQHDFSQENGQIFGSVMNHIVNMGYKEVNGVRQPHHGNRLPFHADQGATDLITLLCLSPAVEGGTSKWVSAIAIHNELLRRGRKDLVEVLSKPFCQRKMATQSLAYRNEKGEYEHEEIVPFQYHDGYLSIYLQLLTYTAPDIDDLELTPLQKEAIWAVLAIAEEPGFHFTHTLEAGDLEIIHNPSIFHSREPYVDGIEDDTKRHLLRTWIHTHANKRPIAPSFAPRSNVEATGGFKVPPGSKLRLPLYPVGLIKE